jgi:DNA-binding transcriptional ArsR family regulator
MSRPAPDRCPEAPGPGARELRGCLARCQRLVRGEIYDQFARIGKALSSGPRIELLDLLSQTERTVEQLAQETSLSFANVSQHLQILRGARLVEVRRQGLYTYYRLADQSVL